MKKINLKNEIVNRRYKGEFVYETTVGMEAAVFDRNNVIFQKKYGFNKEEQIALDAERCLIGAP
jgi:hypothetical protein